jgi:hypothetical protein
VHIIKNNLLPNCPITKADVITAEKIFSQDIGCLHGKTVWKCSKLVETVDDLPLPIPDHYKQVTLAANIMCINDIPFLVTLSTKLKFGISKCLESLDAKTLHMALGQVFKLYKH